MIRLFRVSVPISALGLLTSESALFFSCYILAYFWYLELDSATYMAEDIGRIGVVAVAFIVGAYLSDLYNQIRVRSTVQLLSRMMAILGAAAVFEAGIGYL